MLVNCNEDSSVIQDTIKAGDSWVGEQSKDSIACSTHQKPKTAPPKYTMDVLNKNLLCNYY